MLPLTGLGTVGEVLVQRPTQRGRWEAPQTLVVPGTRSWQRGQSLVPEGPTIWVHMQLAQSCCSTGGPLWASTGAGWALDRLRSTLRGG